WFSSPSLQNGPWTYEPATGLPSDFAKIPDEGPKASVLTAIPGTPQAKEAMIVNQIPQTATISRAATRPTITYEGASDFRPIQGTPMSSAVNSTTPVILSSGSYYACQFGVWFVSRTPTGPWAVATSVPQEIYTIPPTSAVYYVTSVKIYGETPSAVYVGYT